VAAPAGAAEQVVIPADAAAAQEVVAAAPVAAVAETAVAAPAGAAEQVVIPADAAQEVVAAAPVAAVEQLAVAAPAAAESEVAGVVGPAGAAALVVIPPVAAAQGVVAAAPLERGVVAAGLDVASVELAIVRAAAASSPSQVHFVALGRPDARPRAVRPGLIQRSQLTKSSQRRGAVLCSASHRLRG
jgi:hypothetical protein